MLASSVTRSTQSALTTCLALVMSCSPLQAGARGQEPQVGAAEPNTHAHVAPSIRADELVDANSAQQSVDPAELALAKSLVPVAPTEQQEAASMDSPLPASYRIEPSSSTPSMAGKYANLSPAACRMEVRKRKIAAVADHGLAVGISAPMRITAPLHSVRVIAPGRKSVHGKLDCRLVLLLDELCGTLAEFGVASVHVDGFYRPRAHLPGKKSPSQHAYGLAVDIHALGMRDGRSLVIERDFAGRIGAPVCGPSAHVESDSRDSIELRNIVCAMARLKAFHYLLTPNHDPSHRNHLHGDIKRGAQGHVVR